MVAGVAILWKTPTPPAFPFNVSIRSAAQIGFSSTKPPSPRATLSTSSERRNAPRDHIHQHKSLYWSAGFPDRQRPFRPMARHQVLVVDPGDVRPINPATSDWYSGLYVEVKWWSRGVWTWYLWLPLHQGTGRCANVGDCATATEARRAGVNALLERLPPNLSAHQRAALHKLADGRFSVVQTQHPEAPGPI